MDRKKLLMIYNQKAGISGSMNDLFQCIEYLNHENITTETDMSGYSTITLNNIKDIKIK